MEAIVEQIAEEVLTEPIEQTAAFIARLYLTEKGVSHGSQEPLREAGNA